MKLRCAALLLIAALLPAALVFVFVQKAAAGVPSACTGGFGSNWCSEMAIEREVWPLGAWLNPVPPITEDAGTYLRVRNSLTTEETIQQVWMASLFWEDNILPALMLMAEQLTEVSLKHAEIVGTFLDAKHQLETQQVFQRLAARAHKDYHPSEGMCEFGTGAKSLAASDRRSELNAVLLSQRSQDRNLGSANTAAATGEGGDKESRVKQFREKFCDPRDNNNGLAYVCEHDQDLDLSNSPMGVAAPPGPIAPGAGGMGAPDSERKNKDIDYVRTLDAPWTLDVDFTNTVITNNEEEVLALASNLYSQKVFARPPPRSLEAVPDNVITAMQKHYLDERAVVAKRSVAENSFNAIAAMKSAGTPGSRDYLVELLKQLGIPNLAAPNNDADKLLGPNPSYYAQMEVLTKKIFQNPDFFTNLYDTPANVDRKAVAIQAIGLMQKFDLYKSYLRDEASLSVLLDLAVQDLQDEIENELNQISGEGTHGTP